MPPKKSTSVAPRGRPPGSKNKASSASSRSAAIDKPIAASKAKTKGKQPARASESPELHRAGGAEDPMEVEGDDDGDALDEDGSDDEPEKTIPPGLLTRIVYEFFEKDGTRITKDANDALAKYMDVFVKEAIARAAAERDGGFMEVEDLEKIAPQLLLDL
ncbi:hypothetical protein M406DRAFT_291060 [Cryphonectria parasitica EP155]|uniref:Centromere protein X n=1 Tax=Cryphonectria parasitica (strain ATCC 38755 / EP155) TaxID=660469 RepID=A0A9P4Y4J7_CRYP1|nr:uncharacterized protein M406DRAFT_291060 [Cryphonectria parasitica EP155]KAF3766573.1 hypothetical protein M406DRAFT_291060 [Cryphonectria parasitica EP155]